MNKEKNILQQGLTRSVQTIRSHHRSGFTFIELLVVIAIIGVLSAIGLITYKDQLPKARDARRITDIQQIVKAFSLYQLDNGVPLMCDSFTIQTGYTYRRCDSYKYDTLSHTSYYNFGVWRSDGNLVPVADSFKEYGGLPSDPSQNDKNYFQVYIDTDANACCLGYNNAQMNLDCAATHKGWTYVVATLEKPQPNLKRVDPQCAGLELQGGTLVPTANSSIIEQIYNTSNKYIIATPPLSIY